MSYNIVLTNGDLFAVIPDGTINTQSSMTLIGRNYAGGYGQFQDDNFIRLLESGANNSAPGAPLVGQLWYDTSTQTLKVYNGTSFKSLGGATASATAPANAAAGDLWYDSTNRQLDVWTGNTWLAIGPPSSTGTGASSVTILDDNSDPHTLLALTINGNTIAYASQDAAFTPQNTISGFANIFPGITLSTLVNSQTPVFTGTATNTQKLNGISSSGFMSTTNNTSTSGTITVLSNSGIAIGTNSNFTVSISSNTATLQNKTLNGNIVIATNKSGTQTPAITINGATSNVVMASNLSVSNGVTATKFQTAAWTIQEIAGKLYFQTGGANIASLDASGNFTTIGNVTAFGTL